LLEQIIEHLAKQTRLIQDAPIYFFGAVAVVAVIIWRAMEWRYAAKSDLIELYKAKLDGATPEEARTRIENLEKIVKTAIGSNWTALTGREVEALSAAVAAIEKRRVLVMYQNAYGKALARTIADAFEAAGWDVRYSTGSGFEDGIFVGRSPAVSPLMKAAIERTTSLKVIYMPPENSWDEDGPYTGVFVAVGLNPA
jgi:hypothetical protein